MWQDICLLYLFALMLQCLILIPYLIKAPQHHQDTKHIFWRLLDLVLFAVPPGLPLMLLVIGAAARSELKKDGLILMFPEIMKRGAVVDTVLFDKTGTLTRSTVSLLLYARHDLLLIPAADVSTSHCLQDCSCTAAQSSLETQPAACCST